ncbi:hypothetical protein [Paraclostridium sordellii]|uniref:hypothetical protein n=1 Tax=Paraclostridium sordellii TaxID=1505 RepID=UPI000540F1EF|nr:hypothetical protein [Paeniclostridium sordellii]CEK39979.1 hypothetical protein JGS6382_33071 [[Clostridium] sordellii] [Paeniclostridium sordellii]
MNRQEFDSLDIYKQIDYFNKEMSLGLSQAKICEKINLPKSTWRDRLKKVGYKLDQDNKCYRSVTLSNINDKNTHNTIVTPIKTIDITSFHDNLIPDSVTTSTLEILKFKNDLLELAQIKKDILNTIDIVKKYELEKDIIDIVDIKIDSNKMTGDIKTRSFKIYSDILDSFLDFTKKHPDLKQQDILSQFILEGVQRYKR